MIPVSFLVKAGALLAVIAALVGAYTLIDSRGYVRGETTERALWQEREARANAEIARLEKRARDVERTLARKITADNDTRRAADEAAAKGVDAVGDGIGDALRDRVCSDGPTAGDPGAAPGAASGTDGTGSTEFYAAVGDFLSAEAARADRITRKLGQAQALIRLYHGACGQNLGG